MQYPPSETRVAAPPRQPLAIADPATCRAQPPDLRSAPLALTLLMPASVHASQRIAAMARRRGWTEVRTGKHIILRHPTKPGILRVSNHPAKEVAAGTLNSILKEAGLK